MRQKKVSIIGAGRVGSSTAWLCALKGLGGVVLYNRTEGVAKGIALDISHSLPIEKQGVNITGTGSYSETGGSDVIVITAGVQRTAGMTREQLVETNSAIVAGIARETARLSPKAVMVVVTNPLDAMVAVAARESGFQKKRVVGMAGILDSARFSCFIASELNVPVTKVSALVMGSHGEAMVPIISHSGVKGKSISRLLPKEKIDALVQRAIGAGEEIIKLQESSAYYAPAAAITRMVGAIVENKKQELPVTAFCNGEYGVKGMFFGVPAVIGKNGVEKIVEHRITKEEQLQLLVAAGKIRKLVELAK